MQRSGRISLYLLGAALVTTGFGCSGDQSDWIINWFSGGPSHDSDLDFWIANQTDTNQPTNSILEDLYPERYGTGITVNNANTNTNSGTATNANETTPPTNSILEDLYPEKYGTSLWVDQTNIDLQSSPTNAIWMVHVVEGTDTASSDTAVSGAEVTVEFRDGDSGQVSGTTGADGWVSWTRPQPPTAVDMYILDVTGDYPWNSLDQSFWQDNTALAITAEDLE